MLSGARGKLGKAHGVPQGQFCAPSHVLSASPHLTTTSPPLLSPPPPPPHPQDSTFNDILGFLEAADRYGKSIVTVISPTGDEEGAAKHNVSQEARLLRRIYIQLKGEM